MDRPLIASRVSSWLITPEQAKKMLVDIGQDKKDRSSNKFIGALSVLWSLLIWLGTLWFVSANRESMSDIIKTLLLVWATWWSYLIWWKLTEWENSYPKAGNALILLACILFGASIFLIAQTYNVQANAHRLLLIWLVWILPLVYVYKKKYLVVLAVVVFFTRFSTFINQSLARDEINGQSLPVIFSFAWLLLYCLGGYHYLRKDYIWIWRIYRVCWIIVVLCALFVLTFKFFSGYDDSSTWNWINSPAVYSSWILWSLLGWWIISIVVSLLQGISNPTESEYPRIDHRMWTGITVLLLIFMYTDITWYWFTILFNSVFVILLTLLLRRWYARSDMALVNIWLWWICIFILSKYLDWFSELLSWAAFFTIWWVLLLVLWIFLEKKRRNLQLLFKEEWTTKTGV
jgi:uncharacterized membrane protein